MLTPAFSAISYIVDAKFLYQIKYADADQSICEDLLEKNYLIKVILF